MENVVTLTKAQREAQMNPDKAKSPVKKPDEPLNEAQIKFIRNHDKDMVLKFVKQSDNWLAFDWEGDKPVAMNIKATIEILQQEIAKLFDAPFEMPKDFSESLPEPEELPDTESDKGEEFKEI